MKNNTLFLENKQPLSYKTSHRKGALAACVMIVIVTYVVFLTGAFLWGHPLFYRLLPALFLVAGGYFAFLLSKNLPGLTVAERWMFGFGMCVVVMVLLAASVLWDQQLSLRSIFTSAGAFFLPFTILELWRTYAEISFSSIKPWQFTRVDAGDLPSSYLHAQQIRFRVIQEPDVAGGRVIPVNASGRMKLSDVFFQLVQKQNEKGAFTIELHSREREPHNWVFYKKDALLWYRTLDPEKTLMDNQIGKNALIYVQRVSQNAFAAPFAEQKNTFEQ